MVGQVELIPLCEVMAKAYQLACILNYGPGRSPDEPSFINLLCGSFDNSNGQVITSGDPNNLAGPHGLGIPDWIGSIQPLQYQVSFSNEPDASAPAAQIFVTETLDAANLNMTTFKLGAIAFGDWSVTPSDDKALPLVNHPFDANVDLRMATPSRNLIVRVHAQIDILTGVLQVALTSIDPLTMMPTTDPLAGFLDAGKEGSISFSVVPKSTVPTGTVTKEQATVIFDANAPMNTPVWTNTLDNDAPISAVQVLPTQSPASFTVQWTGTDTIAKVAGSGLKDYTIYVSDNGGAFTPWLTNTTDTQDTYVGALGHTYAFISQARDNTYNVEPLRTVADATTTVVLAASGTITLDSFPNAAQPLTFQFRPTDGSASFTRMVTPNMDGTFQILNVPAKSYNVAIKGAIWLQKVVAVDTTNGPVSGVNVTLPGGDANNDNSVDVLDFGILVNAYGGSSKMAGSNYDPTADFNGDGSVDVLDFGILVNNYGVVGDQ